MLKPIITVACLYWLFGKLALISAIPPGYAAVIWPSAGIALAFVLRYGYRVWPGVLIGSFCVNIGVSPDFVTADETVRLVALPLLIGTGAAVQSVFGAWLVKRFLKSLELAKPVDIGKFLLTGIIGCLVSPTAGVAILVSIGVISGVGASVSWATWWVGDIIGVLLFAPLTMAWIAEPTGIWRSRRYYLTIPMAASFIVIASIFFFGYQTENRRVETVFKSEARGFAATLKHQFNEIDGALYSVQGLYASSVFVDRNEFKTFVGIILKDLSRIKSIAWVPVVKKEDKDRFVAEGRADGYPNFSFKELGADGRLKDAADRDIYYPAYYLEPEVGNEIALGIDNGFESRRSGALQRARDTGLPQASVPIVLVQDLQTGDQSVLIAAPVYNKNVALDTVDQRRENIVGFITVKVRIRSLIDEALQNSRWLNNIIFSIADESSSGEREVFHSGRDKKVIAFMREEIRLDVGGRTWKMIFHPAPDFYAVLQTWTLWFVVIGALLLSGFVNVFLLFITGQKIEVDRLVEERTEELRQQQIIVKKALEEARKAEEISREALRVKSEFLSVISHELRTPLSVIRESIVQIFEGLWGPLTEKQKHYLGKSLNNIDRLKKIIDDLLDVSKMEYGKFRIVRNNVNLKKLVEGAAAEFEPLVRSKGLELSVSEITEDIDVFVDEDKIIQVFNNLIGNALKFTEKGFIRIGIKVSAEEVQFDVQDSGKGIAPEDMSRLFRKFEQLDREHGPGAKGTGLGLVIVKEIVKMHGGAMKVSSRPGEGTVFSFTLPRRISSQDVFHDAVVSYLMDMEGRFSEITVIKIDFPQNTALGIAETVSDSIEKSLKRKDDSVKLFGRTIYVVLPLTSVESAFALWERVHEEVLERFPNVIVKQTIFEHKAYDPVSLAERVRRSEKEKNAS